MRQNPDKRSAILLRYNQSKKGQTTQDRYRRTLKSIASSLRSAHGLESQESHKWAKILSDSDTRCAICGVPNYRIKDLGCWRMGNARTNQKLTLDHISPGVNDGQYRALCFSCNGLRGPATLSDAEVLESMRGWYRAVFTLRKLKWLNTHVDETGTCVGGQLYRNDTMRKKIEGLRPEVPCSNAKSVASPSPENGERKGSAT